MPVINPNNLDLVSAILTIPIVHKFFDAAQEGKYLEHEFHIIAENYLRMRRILEIKDNKPSC